MNLHFLPTQVVQALNNLNEKYLSEIRLKSGQPVMICYMGEYNYLSRYGLCERADTAIRIGGVGDIFSKALCGRVYEYEEQLKNGFITVDHGVRIGLAGEYKTIGNDIKTIDCITSLNIRIPHKIAGCSDYIFQSICKNSVPSILIFSLPGYGKTTILRDLTESISRNHPLNILLFDERNEIAAMDAYGNGFDLGERVDVVRGATKINAVKNAIRAMNPQLIVTDELGSDIDFSAIEYAADCGIKTIASTHIQQRSRLKKLPFDYFIQLTGIGKQPLIYDKNFDPFGSDDMHDDDRRISV